MLLMLLLNINRSGVEYEASYLISDSLPQKIISSYPLYNTVLKSHPSPCKLDHVSFIGKGGVGNRFRGGCHQGQRLTGSCGKKLQLTIAV